MGEIFREQRTTNDSRPIVVSQTARLIFFMATRFSSGKQNRTGPGSCVAPVGAASFGILTASEFADAVLALAVLQMMDNIETQSHRRNSAGESEEESIRVIFDYAVQTGI